MSFSQLLPATAKADHCRLRGDGLRSNNPAARARPATTDGPIKPLYPDSHRSTDSRRVG